MNRREAMRERDRIKKQEETERFLNNVGVLHNNIDGLTNPSVGITVEQEKSFTNYFVVKHPSCFSYQLSLYKKEYPFDIYYSKDYRKTEIPEKHINKFEELEGYFND